MALPEFTGSFARRFVRALIKFYYPRIEVTGADKIPQSGPVLLAANHPNSLIDPVLLGIVARRPMRLMAKSTLFDIPLFGKVLHSLGMVPAYRGTDDRSQVARGWKVDPFSTGFLFAGWKERENEPLLWRRRATYEPLVVYLPQTWLLREGWRKHGRISYDEVPSRPSSAEPVAQ